jgi:hypothetical protein
MRARQNFLYSFEIAKYGAGVGVSSVAPGSAVRVFRLEAGE